jgi:NADH:ubiquinone oxidoreductase subunit 6 (subunit J)
MSVAFIVIALFTLTGAVAAMSLRNLVHCALCAALAFAGLAGLFLDLNAQFVGLAQVLVYVGAVAILIVFAILLTRGSQASPEPLLSRSWGSGLAVAALVWASLTAVIVLSPASRTPVAASAASNDAAVRNIGAHLMTDYVLPLEIVALLLTTATIGAVIIAMREKDAEL